MMIQNLKKQLSKQATHFICGVAFSGMALMPWFNATAQGDTSAFVMLRKSESRYNPVLDIMENRLTCNIKHNGNVYIITGTGQIFHQLEIPGRFLSNRSKDLLTKAITDFTKSELERKKINVRLNAITTYDYLENDEWKTIGSFGSEHSYTYLAFLCLSCNL